MKVPRLVVPMTCAVLAASVSSYRVAAAQTVLASGDHESGAKVELLSVKRDSPTVVTVSWRYRNDSAEPKQLTHDRTGWIDPYRLSVESYLLDETNQVKFPVARDAKNKPVASRNGEPNKFITIGPKAAVIVWAKYLVPVSTKTVSVVIDGLAPLGGIKVPDTPGA